TSMLGVGYFIDRHAFARVREIMRESGQSATDFVAMVGFGPALTNMGLSGFIGFIYVIAVGGDLDGPVIGAILSIVGSRRSASIRATSLRSWPESSSARWRNRGTRPILQRLSLRCSARRSRRFAGRFGWQWGLVAGFLHSSVARSVGGVHASLNL